MTPSTPSTSGGRTTTASAPIMTTWPGCSVMCAEGCTKTAKNKSTMTWRSGGSERRDVDQSGSRVRDEVRKGGGGGGDRNNKK